MQNFFEKSWLHFMVYSQSVANWLFEERSWERYEGNQTQGGYHSHQHYSQRRWQWPHIYIATADHITDNIFVGACS